MTDITLAPFSSHDEAHLLELLSTAELSTEDLTPEMLEDFLVARSGAAVVGAAGLEHYEDVGLLRSVAVEEGHRGTGLGKKLVQAMEDHAREAGVRELYLLTTTALDFFTALGYRPAPRAAAPEAIRATEQFSSLCPESSAFLVKTLA